MKDGLKLGWRWLLAATRHRRVTSLPSRPIRAGGLSVVQNADANRLAWMRALTRRFACVKCTVPMRRDLRVRPGCLSLPGTAVAELDVRLLSAGLPCSLCGAPRCRSGVEVTDVTAPGHGRTVGRASKPYAAHLVGSGLESCQYHRVNRPSIRDQRQPPMASAVLDFSDLRHRRDGRAPAAQPGGASAPIVRAAGTQVRRDTGAVAIDRRPATNSSAAINNLRRLGARRGHARGEARRTEEDLAKLLGSSVGFERC